MTTLSQSNSRSFISVINVLCYYCQNIASILQFISFFNHHVVIYCTRIIDAIPYIDNVGISLKNFPLDIFHPPVYYNPLLLLLLVVFPNFSPLICNTLLFRTLEYLLSSLITFFLMVSESDNL